MIRRWSSLCIRNTRLLDKTPHAAAAFATKAPPEDAKTKKKKKETGKKKKKKDPDAGLSEHDRHRFDELVQKALRAPSPVRHITEKERLREAELERYGLMTKAKQVELEQEKAREKARKKAPSSGGGEDEAEKMTPLDKEEGARLAKAYSRLLMRAHRQQQAGESLRLRLKKAAIEALPPGLKEAALVNDMTPFPGISPATLTPPIPGFRYEYELPKDKPKEATADAA